LKIQRSAFFDEDVEFFFFFVGLLVSPGTSFVAESFHKEFHADDCAIICFRTMGCVFPEEL